VVKKRRVRQHRELRGGTKIASPFTTDDDLAERFDGKSVKFVARGYQGRTGSSEPLRMSKMQLFAAVLSSHIFWEFVADLDEATAPSLAIGRPRQHNFIGFALIEFGAWIYGSVRSAIRELDDPEQWAILRRVLISSHPADTTRRLPAQPPSRSSYYRLRKNHLENDHIVELIGECSKEFALTTARAIGQFDITKGTMTHPDPRNSIYGDATFIHSRFNELNPADHVDLDTGEIRRRQRDTDAYAWHNDGKSSGNNWVIASSRNEATNQRVILDIRPQSNTGPNDAATFTDIVLALSKRLPAAQCAVYDMAMVASHVDRLLHEGILPITKVRLNPGGEIPMRQLGEEKFRTTAGAIEKIPVEAIGGTPAIFVVFEGDRVQINLEPRKIKRVSDRTTGYRFYRQWRIPDRPEVPFRLRGAIANIRHNSYPSEIADNRRRTQALRPIPPGTDTFNRLFGIREDSESTNNHLKSLLVNRRARSTGLLRQHINLRAYQILTNIKALIAHSIETGVPLDEFLGNWRPPDRT
jgi:hypothetical protein